MVKETLLTQIATMQDYFNRSTRELAESDSGFAPREGMFTAAQVVAHVAHTIEWFVDGAFAEGGFDMDFASIDALVRTVTSLTAAREWFAKAIARAQAVVEAHSDEEWLDTLQPNLIMGEVPRMVIFGAITDHTAHHRGALTVYTRLLGKVPPMPYMDA